MAEYNQPPNFENIPKKPSQKSFFSDDQRSLFSNFVKGLIAITFFFIAGVLVGRGQLPEEAKKQATLALQEKNTLAASSRMLKPEELEYFDELTKIPNSASPQKPPMVRINTAPTQRETPIALQPRTDIYEYLYQITAVASQEKAQEYLTKLEQVRLAGYIEKATTKTGVWFRVLVIFQGDTKRVTEVEEILRSIGVKQTIIRRKTHVPS